MAKRGRTERAGQRELDALLAAHPEQREPVRAGLRALVTEGRWAQPLFGLALVRTRGRVGIEPDPKMASARSRVVASVINLVLSHARAIRACARCGDPFLSLGRRRFCSAECTQRAMDERKAQKRTAALARRRHPHR